MDLVDRYLQAVKLWLPSRHKKDIIAELADDIRSEVEEKERGLGRKLGEPELEALIMRRGRPIVAAARFQPRHSLIGPELYPIYFTALKALAVPYLVLWIVRWAYLLITSASTRAESPVALVGHAASMFWSTGLLLFGVVTLVFAIVERVQRKTHFLEAWNPRDLAPVRDSQRTHRSSSITSLALEVAFMLWWIHPQAFFTLESEGLKWSAGPTWSHLHGTFFFPVLLVALGTAVLDCVELVHPYRTRLRTGLRAATHWGVAFVALVVLAEHWPGFYAEIQVLRGPARPASEAAFVTGLTDILVYLSLASVGIGASVAFVVEAIRALRLKTSERPPLEAQSTEAFCP